MIGKGWDGAAPIGPWITRAEVAGDPAEMAIELRVNGVPKQQSSTAKMIFSVAELVAFYGRVLTLEVGDVIATGTPAGVGAGAQPPEFLKPGDVMEAEIGDLGILRTSFAAPRRRSSSRSRSVAACRVSGRQSRGGDSTAASRAVWSSPPRPCPRRRSISSPTSGVAGSSRPSSAAARGRCRGPAVQIDPEAGGELAAEQVLTAHLHHPVGGEAAAERAEDRRPIDAGRLAQRQRIGERVDRQRDDGLVAGLDDLAGAGRADPGHGGAGPPRTACVPAGRRRARRRP